jgi:hypothetical protein
MRCQALPLEIPKTDVTRSRLVRYDVRDQSAKVGLRDPPIGGCTREPKALLNRALKAYPSMNPRFIAIVTA